MDIRFIISELIKNSLDANCQYIHIMIHVNTEKNYSIRIDDDGVGMSKNTLEHIRIPLKTPEKNQFINENSKYGKNNEFLFELIHNNVDKVTIKSARIPEFTRTHLKYNLYDQLNRTNASKLVIGTQVTVEGKSNEPFENLNDIIETVKNLALYHHDVSFLVRDQLISRNVFECNKVDSQVNRFKQISGLLNCNVEVINYNHRNAVAKLIVSYRMLGNENSQFIFVNHKRLRDQCFKDSLNKLLHPVIRIIEKNKIQHPVYLFDIEFSYDTHHFINFNAIMNHCVDECVRLYKETVGKLVPMEFRIDNVDKLPNRSTKYELCANWLDQTETEYDFDPNITKLEKSLNEENWKRMIRIFQLEYAHPLEKSEEDY